MLTRRGGVRRHDAHTNMGRPTHCSTPLQCSLHTSQLVDGRQQEGEDDGSDTREKWDELLVVLLEHIGLGGVFVGFGCNICCIRDRSRHHDRARNPEHDILLCGVRQLKNRGQESRGAEEDRLYKVSLVSFRYVLERFDVVCPHSLLIKAYCYDDQAGERRQRLFGPDADELDAFRAGGRAGAQTWGDDSWRLDEARGEA